MSYEPEEKSPARSFLRQDFLEKDRKHTENAEYLGDPESTKDFDFIEVKEIWNNLCAGLSCVLEMRGIDVDADYISDFLAAEQEAIENATDANKAQKAKADAEEFNLHLSKLTELQAALILLRLKYHYSFGRIGSLLSLSDQQADNFYQIAESAFDSDDIQNAFFSNHCIHLYSKEQDLTGVLLKNARNQKSRAGRPTKSQARKAKANNLASQVSNGDLLELGV